jgi:hypothetical protein
VSIRPKHIMGRSEKGQSTAEFIAVLPFLLLLFFLIVEFGWLLKNYLVVTNAGREVARCAAVDDCRLDSVVVTATDLAIDRIRDGGGVYPDDVGEIEFSIHHTGTGVKGDSLIVCIESPSRAVTPLTIFAGWTGVLPNPVPLRARTEMRIEAPNGYSGADLSGSSGLCS